MYHRYEGDTNCLDKMTVLTVYHCYKTLLDGEHYFISLPGVNF